MYKYFFILFLLAGCAGCKEDTTNADSHKATDTPPTTVEVPAFEADSACGFIARQLEFGHRIPGTPAHKKCANWLIDKMKTYADTVYVQEASVLQKATNKNYSIINIIGSFNPTMSNRILLLAHWDSRPWADEDNTNTDKPIPAADDGGSGVAVLLQIAAHLQQKKPNVGVDILLVDAEDLGKSEWGDESYCLGSQYWAQHPHIAGYKAQYGICLDMVGAKGAVFPIEAYSDYYAPGLVKQLWEIGNQIGYSDYFRYTKGGPITDDHLFVNKIINIPTVDIIHVKPMGGFGAHWHTHQDNMDVIDKRTLKAVGQTLLHYLYNI